MGCVGRFLTPCVLVCGLASPAAASVFASQGGAGKALCAQQPAVTAGCAGAARLASVDDLSAIGLGAQPILRSVQPARTTAQSTGARAAPVRSGAIAPVSVSERDAGASAEGAAPLLFWMFGSALLGAGFVARRRKRVLGKT